MPASRRNGSQTYKPRFSQQCPVPTGEPVKWMKMAGRENRLTSPWRRENACTGLDIIVAGAILLILVAVPAYLLLQVLAAPEQPRGIVPGAVTETENQLNVFGSIDGFPASTGSSGGVPVLRSNPDPRRLGAVRMTISLFLGNTGGVDMAQTNVTWTDSAGTEILSLTKRVPVVCPNWTIAKKYNVNPFKTADKDDVLEPGEQFDVFICPSDTLPPYEEFMVMFDPPGSGPRFPVKCTVPFMITTTMVL